MSGVNQVDDWLVGTVLWYDGVRHVVDTIGTQIGEGAVEICKRMAVNQDDSVRPPAFMAGVRDACAMVIHRGGMPEPRKTVRAR